MFFTYLLISSVLLCVGYLAYKWIPSKEHQHALNRFTIYLIYVAALILPVFLLWSPNSPAESFVSPSIEIGVPLSGLVDGTHTGSIHENWTKWISLSIIILYFSGVVFCTIQTVYGYLYLLRLIRNGQKSKIYSYILVIIPNKGIAPFSWLNYIVIQEDDYNQFGSLILAHESSHLKFRHWIDLLFAQVVCIFQWFNPAAWLLREEFRTVHEYQADEAVIRNGVDLRSYQTMLIKKAVGMRFQSLANSLNHSKLKKRVTMMYKEKTSGLRRYGALILIPAMAAGCALFEIPAVAKVVHAAEEIHTDVFGSKDNEKYGDSKIISETVAIEMNETSESLPENLLPSSTDNSVVDSSVTEDSSIRKEEDNGMQATSENTSKPEVEPESEKICMAVEQSAEFPGGMRAMMIWLGDHIVYPDEAVSQNEEGRVVVKFIVEANGKISDPTIVKGVSPSLDKEAIRVVNSMPDWKPAQNDGKSVASWFTLPVSFKLSNAKTEEATK